MSRWPGGKKFAFTIMDDTDRAYLGAVKPFYDALCRYGFRTTKTVWAFDSPPSDPFRGDSLQNPAYRAWVLDLKAAGFEIAWHGARSGGTEAPAHREALDYFHEIFGVYPRTYANHAVNPECLYWGEERFDSPLVREMFRRLSGRKRFLGSTPGTPYHWEDLCAQRLRYVRGFNFDDTVTSRQDPWMPYHDPRRPAVSRWFSASDGSDVERFVHLLSPSRVELLDRSEGCCIVYAHIADGFVRQGRVDSRVLGALEDLAARDGWYVPVEAVLDHIEAEHGTRVITTAEHRRLEWRWAAYQVKRHINVAKFAFPWRRESDCFAAKIMRK
jgi:hypothetical protein